MQKHIRVEQYTVEGDYIATFPSIKEAAKQVGVDLSSISRALKFQVITVDGYIWAYDRLDAEAKIKIINILNEVDYLGEAVATLDNIYELQLLNNRVARRKSVKIRTKLLDDDKIWVKLTKKQKQSLPDEEEEDKPKKPKWWLCYRADNLGYRYAIDFGRGDTPKEAIKSFKRSRGLSNLKHEVVYIDRDYYKVLSYLLSHGGQTPKGAKR